MNYPLAVGTAAQAIASGEGGYEPVCVQSGTQPTNPRDEVVAEHYQYR